MISVPLYRAKRSAACFHEACTWVKWNIIVLWQLINVSMQNCLCFCLRDFGRLLKSEYKPMLTLLTVRIHHKDFYGFSLFCVHFFFFLHSFRLFNVFFHRCWKFNCSDFLCDFTWYFYFYSLSVVRLTLVCLCFQSLTETTIQWNYLCYRIRLIYQTVTGWSVLSCHFSHWHKLQIWNNKNELWSGKTDQEWMLEICRG